MILSEVRIHNFRNIASTSLILNPNFNCITDIMAVEKPRY